MNILSIPLREISYDTLVLAFISPSLVNGIVAISARLCYLHQVMSLNLSSNEVWVDIDQQKADLLIRKYRIAL